MLREITLIQAAIEQRLVSAEQVAQLQSQARRERKELLKLLCFSARIPLSSVYRAFAEWKDIPYLDGKLTPDVKRLRKLPRSLSQRRLIVPVQIELDTPRLATDQVHTAPTNIVLAVADPQDQAGIEQARRVLSESLPVVMATPQVLQRIIEQTLAAVLPPGLEMQAPVGQPAAEFDPVDMLDELFNEAYLQRASDLHFEPLKERFQVRLRIDGRLQLYPQQLSVEEGQSLMSRMKVLTGMDIAEQRLPQDGNLHHIIAETGASFDVRAATLPTRFGERATLRILGTDAQTLSLAKLGFSTTNLSRFQETIRRPYGMVLITGPTGSGKSTTLYSALQEIAASDINIMTAEDPIEYEMEGVAQVQVNSKVSFADALRSFLRHDPDVIMVGEIRDGETANIALKAAMTGHLVFSTVHTNSAIATINRLADMGVARYLIGSTLIAVIAQRLVRRLCSVCKQPYHPDASCKTWLGEHTEDLHLYRAHGCAHCMGSGYRGRVALFEVLWVDAVMGELISRTAGEIALHQQASHFSSLSDDAYQKLKAGVTSWDEVSRLALLGGNECQVRA